MPFDARQVLRPIRLQRRRTAVPGGRVSAGSHATGARAMLRLEQASRRHAERLLCLRSRLDLDLLIGCRVELADGGRSSSRWRHRRLLEVLLLPGSHLVRGVAQVQLQLEAVLGFRLADRCRHDDALGSLLPLLILLHTLVKLLHLLLELILMVLLMRLLTALQLSLLELLSELLRDLFALACLVTVHLSHILRQTQ